MNRVNFSNLIVGMILGAALVIAGQWLRPPSAQDRPTAPIAGERSSANAMGLETIADLAEVAGKSTVNIDTTATVSAPPSSLLDAILGGEEVRKKGLGSGFIVREDGYIITNNHVIDSADDIRVTLHQEQKSFPARLVGRDPETDLALLKIDRKGLPVASLGSSRKIRPGDWVVAIGSPLGLQQSVTLGIVSALNRSFADFGPAHLIQTDAAINPGNSGGPLVDIHGEVIGVNVMIRRDAQNIGFAIPVETARDVTEQLLKSGRVTHPHSIGMAFADFLVETSSGEATVVVVVEVKPRGAASQAGLRTGDVILSAEGQKITAVALEQLITGTPAGQRLNFRVFRDGRTREVGLTVP